MTESEEIARLKSEVVPAIAQLAWSMGWLAAQDEGELVDPFEVDAQALFWWDRICKKVQAYGEMAE